MKNVAPSACVVMTVEIEIPGGLPDELVDAIVEDLTYADHQERLRRLIKRWAGFIAGQSCHVAIDVE